MNNIEAKLEEILDNTKTVKKVVVESIEEKKKLKTELEAKQAEKIKLEAEKTEKRKEQLKKAQSKFKAIQIKLKIEEFEEFEELAKNSNMSLVEYSKQAIKSFKIDLVEDLPSETETIACEEDIGSLKRQIEAYEATEKKLREELQDLQNSIKEKSETLSQNTTKISKQNTKISDLEEMVKQLNEAVKKLNNLSFIEKVLRVFKK